MLRTQDEIKQELERLGTILEDPAIRVPNLWDYILPAWVARRLLRVEPRRPCRLVIFVDDLDRCPPAKSVEVLQALQLLTEGTPFIIYLAIDPRIVVSAIEACNDNFFGKCGVNGYECA